MTYRGWSPFLDRLISEAIEHHERERHSLPPMAERASKTSALNYLDNARAHGYIFAYERLEPSKPKEPVRWRIETQPTRYAAFNDPDATGVIVLTTREVMAFIEGVWAATRTKPVTRAGASDGSAIRDFNASRRQPG